MKKLLLVGLLGGLLAAWLMPTPAIAQDAFDGTWKVDLNKAHMPKKPDILLLQNGIYECKTCTPAVSIKADGEDHKVTGHPYFDTMAVKATDDHSIQETNKRDGKVVATSTMTVAPDGKTASFEFTDSSNTNADPVTGKGTMTRVALGPKGAHAISGSWRTASYSSVSDNGLTFAYKVDGDNLSMSSPTGQSYTARMDGTDAPYKGDPGTTSVSIRKLGKNSLQETDKRDGKVISISKMTVAADGRTMDIAVDDKLRGTSMSFVAAKQ